MRTRILSADDDFALEEVASTLHRGELVAFPTDTVYGLGALVTNQQAIERLYLAKGRNLGKAIAVLIGNLEALEQITDMIGDSALKMAQHFWPGPLTLVVPRNPALPANISPLPTVGVRMPNHPLALRLLNLVGPLAVSSANLSGESNASTASEVYKQLGGLIPLILDGGQTTGGVPSTVVDCTSSELVVLREGPISLEQLKAVIAAPDEP